MTAGIEFALVPDHTPQALALLIDQYRGLPRFSGLIASYVNRIQEFESVMWDVVNKRLLDYTALDGSSAHAVAQQLDAIGRLVGRGRNGQDDALYLIYIRAQIFLNNSRGLRGDIVRLLQLIESGVCTYTEYYPASALIAYASTPSTDPNILLELAKLAITEGVKLELIAPSAGTDAAHTFTCCNNGDTSDPSKGFGDASDAIYGGQLASAYA